MSLTQTPARDPAPRILAPYESQAAIRVGMTAREQIETRWGLILVIFMRLLAGLWILQGLLQWSLFLLPADAIFDHLTMGQTAAIMFFAVIDLLAAVGLWLATPWGGVLWLFAAISQIFVAISMKHVFTLAWMVVDCVLIIIYFGLTWQAGKVSRLPEQAKDAKTLRSIFKYRFARFRSQ